MKESFMRKYGLQAAYIVLLNLCFPMNLMYMWLEGIVLAIAPQKDYTGIMAVVHLILGLAYIITVMLLGILNIVNSFRLFRQKDIRRCVNGMLIFKYGMIIFFISNYLIIAMGIIGGGLLALIASRGTFVLLLPFFLPGIAVFIMFFVFLTWLVLIPGAFYGVQVVRLSRGEHKLGTGAALLHGFLQFCFLVDVLDAMYLSVRKWGMGKKSAVLIGIIYVGTAALVIWSLAAARGGM